MARTWCIHSFHRDDVSRDSVQLQWVPASARRGTDDFANAVPHPAKTAPEARQVKRQHSRYPSSSRTGRIHVKRLLLHLFHVALSAASSIGGLARSSAEEAPHCDYA